jgi:hypothetical protein
MNIYLVCKHRKFSDNWGHGVYKECIVLKPFTNKKIAQNVVKDLNSRAEKYWYSIKKLVIVI